MSLVAVEKCEEALEYVVTVVFCLKPKHKIWKALVHDVKDED